MSRVFHRRAPSRSAGSIFVATALALCVGASTSFAADIYVAPNGLPTNAGTIGQPLDLATAVSGASPAQPGDTVWLLGGTYQGTWVVAKSGASGNPITFRQALGERATLDGNGSAQPVLTVTASYVTFWGFEITSSNPQRTTTETGPWPSAAGLPRGAGIEAFGTNLKFINLVIHDLRQGIGLWEESIDSEVYGTLIYNNGWQATDGSHGHGIYTQSENGARPLRENIIFNQFDHGVHAYGSSSAAIDNITLEGNVVFQNGILGEAGLQRDILIGGPLAHNPVLNENFTFGGTNTYLGLGDGCVNGTVTGNYFAGRDPFVLEDCVPVMTGNTLYGLRALSGNSFDTMPIAFPNNQYHYVRPTTNFVTVRKNLYETGRGHIVIYNWTGTQSLVSVDLSPLQLQIGDRYEIRDAQNFFGTPVVRGVYDGNPVDVPMIGLPIAAPVGNVPVAPSHSDPDFGVFVVLHTDNPDPIVPAAPAATPTIDPPGGIVSGQLSVSIETATPGAEIRYTTNGVTPDAGSPLYAGPITVRGTSTVRARAFAGGLLASDVASASFTNSTPGGGTGSSALFVGEDAATHGNWIGAYGTEGYLIASDAANIPSYAQVTREDSQTFSWAPSTSELRALQRASGGGRHASTWYSFDGMTFHVSFPDGQPRQVALYVLDWDSNDERVQHVWLRDAVTGTLLDVRTVDHFGGGKYLVWEVTGNVRIEVDLESGINAVVSGLFIDPATAAGQPRVSITEPVTGTIAAKHENLTIKASALDFDGTITQVEFFANGASLGVDTDAPYQVTWSDLPIGTYALTAVVTDNSANTTTSQPVQLIVVGNRIMALGDSHTYGIGLPTYGGYRIKLHTLLTNGGVSFNFVGSQASGPPALPDQEHEGHNGFRLDELNAGLAPWLNAHRPEVILLMGGTNDILQGQDPIGDLGTLVANIFSILPDTTVVVASIPPITYLDQFHGAVNAYNAQIPGLVSAQAGLGRKIYFADINAALTNDDISTVDGIHLTAAGYDKAADAWFPAIYAFLEPDIVATPTFTPTGGSFTEPVSVTIETLTPDADIYYTLDGTTPTTASTLYTGPVLLNDSATPHTITARGFAAGMFDSAVSSDTYEVHLLTVETPVISPDAGSFSVPVSVTITTATPGATIRYTLDGSEPTSSSPLYTGAFSRAADTTIRARAFKVNMLDSAEAMATLDIELLTIDTPTFTPEAGTYTGSVDVTIETLTAGTSIYYTLDGTPPTAGSTLYSGPFALTSTTTVRARAFKSDMHDSAEATTTFSIKLAAPTIAPPAGTVLGPLAVTLSSTAAGVDIRYTLDGTDPDATSTLYTDPIPLISDTTVKARAFGAGVLDSDVATAVYDVLLPPAAAPTISPNGGTFATEATVTLASATAGATIYYTTDGTTPSAASPIYSAPFLVTSSTTVKAFASAVNYIDSAVATASFNIGTAAFFRGVDAAARGGWIGVYGGDGGEVVNDNASYPAYAEVSQTGGTAYTWEVITSDPRALYRLDGSERYASAWYGDVITLDINLSDGQAHELALYMVDFDSTSRAQTVEVRDAVTDAILDSRALNNFNGGRYFVWDLTGHVKIVLTRTGGLNAVASGLFFAPPGGQPLPSVIITSPAHENSFISPAALEVTATVGELAGVQQVEFFANGSSIGVDTTSPYGIAWRNVPQGSYELVAVATDSTSNPIASAPIVITAADDAPISGLQRVGSFEQPVHATGAGDGTNRLFVAELKGRIWVVQGGVTQPVPFMDLSANVGCPNRLEMNMAFPPGFASSKRFYVKYINSACELIVSRFSTTPDGSAADMSTEQVLLQETSGAHNGGPLYFGPDGYLYVSFGNASDHANSQDPSTILGKIVRIDVETGSPATYTVPASNPFVGTPGYAPEIWATGLRNPWRISFDRLTGDLYIGDVGENTYEEINFQPAGSPGGENYGWTMMEGTHCNGGACNPAGLTLPVAEYSHDFGCSVTGGHVYRGSAIPDMQGLYLYGDWCSGNLWGLRKVGATWDNSLLRNTEHGAAALHSTGLRVVSFGDDDEANVYLLDYGHEHDGGAEDTGGVYLILNTLVGAPQATFSATPPAVAPGQSSTLSWTTTNAVSVSIDQSIGPVAVNGSTSVTPAATTTYTLTATNAAGAFVTKSATVTISVEGPTNLVATPQSMTQIDLTWTDNSSTEEGFKIERCEGTGCVDFVEITQVGPSETTYSDTTLVADTHYRYRARAFVAAGDSVYSEIAAATTLAAPATVAAPVIAPAGGSFSGPVVVTMSSATPTAAIHYTTDGSDPTPGSPLYSGPFLLGSSGTLKAMAAAPTMLDSSIASASFTIAGGADVGAVFVARDTATQGTWHGTYGTEGANVIGDASSYPAYAQLTPSGHTAYTWLTSTTDVRAPERLNAAAGRLASTWYAAETFSLDLNLNDGAAHQVAFYAVDWDSTTRVQRIDVRDAATGALLDTRTLSGFTNGQYLVYQLTGHVKLHFTKLVGANAVLMGVFFDAAVGGIPAAAAPTISPNGGTFDAPVPVTLHTSTPGATIRYTIDGSTPTAVSTAYAGEFIVATTSTVKARAFAAGMTASAVSSAAFTLNLPQAATPTISPNGGSFTAPSEVTLATATSDASIHYTTDGSTPTTASPLYAGPFTLSATGTVRAIAAKSGMNNSAVASAAFTIILPGSNNATYVKTDTTTIGNWPGVYGANAAAVIGDVLNFPSYAAVTPSGNSSWTWTTATSDPRAPQKTAGGGRVAGTWYTATNYTIDVNITDGQSHQIAFYLLDWDTTQRSERIDVRDASTNALFDSRTITAFNGGQYVVYTISGHVIFQITRLAGVNAALSGIFFDPVPSGLPTAATPTISPNGGSHGTAQTVTLSTTTGGATIRYTTDGSTPTASSTQYTAPFSVATTSTVKARAFAPGFNDSAVASATFTIGAPAGLKIMPLGDSLTYGIGLPEYGGYRIRLFNQLTAAGLSFDFVGTVTSGPSSLADKDHDGHNGWTIDQITAEVQAWLNATNPQVILLLAGTNDVLQNQSDTSTELAALIDAIFALRPTSTIVVGSIPPIDDAAANARAVTLNAAIPGIVTARASAGKQIYFADIYAAMTTADLNGDGIHPNAIGYDKIADVWYERLAAVYALSTAGTPSISPPGGTSSTPVSITLTSSTSGATIRYTLDGSTPTSSSTLYTAPFTVSSSGTVKARAFKAAMAESAVATAAFTITAPGATSASFVTTDIATKGTWQGVYGTNSAAVIGDVLNYPAYAVVTPTGHSAFTWMASTPDVRALQKTAGGGRIAGTWYSSGSFTVDVNVTDGQAHQVAFYLLDWDTTARAQRVDVRNPGTGAVLDSRIIAGFNGGQYLVYNISGHVTFQFTRTAGVNAVIGGIFFDPAPSTTPTVATPTITPNGGIISAPTDVTLATTTAGAQIYYTTDGSTPSTSSTLYAGAFSVSATTTVKARAYAAGMTDSAVATATFTFQVPTVATPTITPNGGSISGPTNVTLQTTTAGATIHYTTDGATPTAASPTYTAAFSVSSTTTVKAMAIASGLADSAVASATFTFTPPSSNSAAFVKTDATTLGNWQGVYGANAAGVIGDVVSSPAYAVVTPSGHAAWTWMASTGDARALQRTTGGGRIAGTWYAATSFTVDINVTDGQTHQVAFYLLDWDTTARSERIDVRDASTNALLESRTLAGFNGGQYVVFNISGHVTFQFTKLAGINAVISGLFFDPVVPATPTAATPTISPNGGTFTEAQTVSLATTTGGATIRYTTDGSTPNGSSTPYTAPFSVAASSTVKAVAFASGLANSAVATATFTITPPGSTSATFVKTDTTTQGSWQGTYGAAGAAIIGDVLTYPPYAVLTPTGHSSYTWAGSTTELRALQRTSGGGRLASTWYSSTSMSLDLNLTDGLIHQVALYLLDWDHQGRVENIQIRDAVTGTVLDTRSASGFAQGLYLVWQVRGHVIIQITRTTGANAVLSGVFIEP